MACHHERRGSVRRQERDVTAGRMPGMKAAIRGPIAGSVQVLRSSADLAALQEALARAWRNNVPGMAATIAFFGFLSMVPLVLLLLAFIGNVMQGVISDADIRRLFHGVVPGLSEHQFLQT